MLYRTKVRTVEAFRWLGQPCDEWPEWATSELVSESSKLGLYAHLKEGPKRVHLGDWVILQGDQKLYACTDSEFNEQYELAPFADQPSDSPPNLGD